MGQYYHVIAKRDGEKKVYSPMDFDYGFKLMEHSYWHNTFCCSIANAIVDKPTKICWCGDYAEQDECEALGFYYDDVWHLEKTDNLEAVKFDMSSVKYLINNDKKLFVDLQKYYEKSQHSEEWEGKQYDYTIFPISILTCLGNDRGGGDYHEECATCWDSVGSWAFDEIYLSNELPDGYSELDVYFQETR